MAFSETSVEALKFLYQHKKITKATLKVYVKNGVIAANDYENITGEVYK